MNVYLVLCGGVLLCFLGIVFLWSFFWPVCFVRMLLFFACFFSCFARWTFCLCFVLFWRFVVFFILFAPVLVVADTSIVVVAGVTVGDGGSVHVIMVSLIVVVMMVVIVGTMLVALLLLFSVHFVCHSGKKENTCVHIAYDTLFFLLS